MGRYAFFSTGLEYKFVFATQSSEDIEMFGGIIFHENANSGKIKWTQNDIENIKISLDHLFVSNGITDFDIHRYEKNIQGTHLLKFDLEKKLEHTGSYKTILGVLIYHQLLYTETLTCKYDI
jgi:hypothetical protein